MDIKKQAEIQAVLGPGFGDLLATKKDKDLATASGVPLHKIRKWRRALGIEKPRGRPRKQLTPEVPVEMPAIPPRVTPVRPTQKQRIRARLGDYWFDRLGVDTLQTIADAVGLSRERIRQYCTTLGIKSRNKPKPRFVFEEGLLATKTNKEIAEIIGCSQSCVSGARRRLGITRVDPKRSSEQGRVTRGRVLPLLSTMTNASIARLTGLSKVRVQQIRFTARIPGPSSHAWPSDEALIERIACALGADIELMRSSSAPRVLAQKHGISICLLRMWREALHTMGYFDRPGGCS